MKHTPKVKIAKSKKNSKDLSTHLVLILDRSGSMMSLRDEAQAAVNKFIKEQKDGPGKCRLTFVRFDDEYEQVFSERKIADVTEIELVPRSMTALFDAVGKTINSVANDTKKSYDKTIFVVMTDGLENASREFSADKIKTLVKEYEDKGWDFVFLAAGLDNFEAGMAQMAFSPKSSHVHAASAAGYSTAMTSTSSAILRARATGKAVAYTDDESDAINT